MQSQYEPVSMPDTQRRTLKSVHVGATYEIRISLPHRYDVSGERYAVVYLLDGNGLFGVATEMLRLLDFFGGMRQVIVVGIAYPDVRTFPETMGLRTRDYTPTDEGWYRRAYESTDGAPPYVGEGGADRFLSFVCDEVVPFLESEYHASSAERVLAGYSFGGLAVLKALFSRHDVFHRFLVSSPSLWWGDGVIARLEADYADHHEDLAAWVYMATGANEGDDMGPPMESLAETLRARDYPSLTLTARLLEDETHLTAFPAFLSRAFIAAFDRGE